MAFTDGKEFSLPEVEFGLPYTIIGSKVFTTGLETPSFSLDIGSSCLAEGAKAFTAGKEFSLPATELSVEYTKINNNKVFGLGNVLYVFGLPAVVGDTGIVVGTGYYGELYGTPRLVQVGGSVQFGINILGPTIKSQKWNYGDGEEEYAINPLHTYDIYGWKTITLTIVDEGDNTLVFRKSNYIYVQPVFVCDFIGIPRLGKSPLTVDFTAIYSVPDKTVKYEVNAYKWYFDYGRYPNLYEISTTPFITHVYTGYYGKKFDVKLEIVLSGYNS